MFTVRLTTNVCLGYGQATARAATIRGAIDFASEFAPNGAGVITSSWIERDGQYVREVYDWCDCWFAGPIPVHAEIIAPSGSTTHPTGTGS